MKRLLILFALLFVGGLCTLPGAVNQMPYISSLREGNEPSLTKYLLHADGTNNQTSTIDSSSSANTMYMIGGAKIITAAKMFGTGSFYFTGTTDYVTSPATTDFDVSSNIWTLDVWVNSTNNNAGNHIIFYQPGAGTYSWMNLLRITSNIQFNMSSTSNSWAPISGRQIGVISINSWNHIAIGRQGASLYYWLNGVQGTGSPTNIGASTSFMSCSNTIKIGNGGGGQYWYGYIDELRFTKGLCRWTNNFTPPTMSYGE